MPYITDDRRKALNEGAPPQAAGELNYMVTRAVDRFLWQFGEEPSYFTLNEAIGVLECAKLEMYRRICAPYEDIKCQQNGDVYQLPVHGPQPPDTGPVEVLVESQESSPTTTSPPAESPPSPDGESPSPADSDEAPSPTEEADRAAAVAAGFGGWASWFNPHVA